MTMPGEAGGAARAWRRLARLLMGRNKLRRPSDRIEGAVALLLSAAFLAAVIAAPVFGAAIYRSQRAAAARMHPAVAVLAQNGPYDGGVAGDGQALARWPVPGGRQRSGLLTTQTAPGIWGASAGTRVPVWLNASGEPAEPPPGATVVLFTAIVIAISAACGAGIALILCYWLFRLVLDRRRLAAWESAWALTGPRWTTRR
jgi:hypothetical protein